MRGFRKFTSKIGNRILFCYFGIIALIVIVSAFFFNAQRIALYSQEEMENLSRHLPKETQENLDNLNELIYQVTSFYTGLIFACVVLALLIVFLYVHPRIIQRLARLSRNINRLESGEYDHEIITDGNDDISEMLGSLEKLRLSLTERQKFETELIKIKDELEDNERRYLLTSRAAHLGLWDWDPSTNVTYFNDEWYTMLGYMPGELPAEFETFEKLCHPDDFQKVTKALSEHFDTGREYKINIRLRHKKGHWIWVMSTGRVTNWDDQGRPVRMSGIHSDITERKRVNDELQRIKHSLEQEIETRTMEYKEQKLIAERANKTKDEFLANMSHELRTPLNSIQGMTNILLEERRVSDEVKHDLEVIKTSSDSLLSIVNDVLDISKIEAGALELENKPFNAADVLFSVVAQLGPLAKQKKLKLSHNFDEFSRISIMGDPSRLRQILVNLIGNAIKYTEQGEVNINVVIKSHKVSSETKAFICEVKDTGIGIPSDKLPTIFDKFTQAESTSSRKYQGTGLGLNITKLLVDIMGGDIRVHSELGKGSVFILNIPFKRAKGELLPARDVIETVYANAPDIKIDIEKAHILVAEDHELNQLYMRKLLEKTGCKKFEFSDNGSDAIDAYKSGQWDLILMDCHMPQLNGYEATRMIRNLERDQGQGAHIPIIAVTADAMHGTRQACLDAGMDLYISKPIDEKNFRDILQNWFIIESISKPRTDDDADNEDFIDLSLLKEYSNDDMNFEKQLIQSFLDTSRDDLTDILNNTQKAKHTVFTEAAHKLKGSSAFIGAFKLSNMCQRAQVIDTSEKSPARKLLAQDIEKEFEKVVRFLTAQGYFD